MYATVQELVDALTPEEKIGQLFIIRPDALDLTLPQETIIRLLTHNTLGGREFEKINRNIRK